MASTEETSQQPASGNQKCFLLALPAELRLNIYEQASPPELHDDYLGGYKWSCPADLYDDTGAKAANPALLYACFEIYREALPVYEKHLDALFNHAEKINDLGESHRAYSGMAYIPPHERKSRAAMKMVRMRWEKLGRVNIRAMVSGERVAEGRAKGVIS